MQGQPFLNWLYIYIYIYVQLKAVTAAILSVVEGSLWIFQQGLFIVFQNQRCIFFYNSPHLVGGGGGKSKSLRAREENQRRVKKMEGLRGGGEEGKNFGGLSYFIPSWARKGRGGGKIILDSG